MTLQKLLDYYIKGYFTDMEAASWVLENVEPGNVVDALESLPITLLPSVKRIADWFPVPEGTETFSFTGNVILSAEEKKRLLDRQTENAPRVKAWFEAQNLRREQK